MKKPKLIALLSEGWTMTDPRDLKNIVRFAREAEDAGIDGIMIGEHVVMGPNSCFIAPPVNQRDWLMAGNQVPEYPHPNNLHPFSAISSVTSRIRLLAASVIAPLRHPLMLAKELATLDLLSEGRLIVLPSVSWQEEEYAALAVPFHQRGAILDEQLDIWQRLWTQRSPVSFEGKHFAFRDISVVPEPYRLGSGVTLWTGGRSLIPAIQRRAVKHAQGLFLLKPPSAEELAQLDSALQEAGRSLDDIELAAIVSDSFKGADDRLNLDRVVENSLPLQERGFSTLIIKPSQFIDDGAQMAAFCREAVRKFGA